MQVGAFDEAAFFRVIDDSGARALLIGRRALIALGLPVTTFDYDYWIHTDDAAAFNAALEPLDLYPNRPLDEARKHGRYVLENEEKVDVLVARAVTTRDGVKVTFDDVWPRRQRLPYDTGISIYVPSLDDPILTKGFGSRPRDADDIALLRMLMEPRP